MLMRRLILCLAIGCGGQMQVMTMQPMTEDVRVPVPAADPNIWDVLGADAVINAKSEKELCLYTSYTGPDTAFTFFDGYQGKWGHHVVLFTPNEPKADGTVEDCSDAAYMAKIQPFAITTDSLPAGIASHLPTGQHVVIQSHYINTSDHPIEIRDVLRLHLMSPSNVTTWGSAIANGNGSGIAVPPNGTQQLVSDCVVPQDMQVLEIGGHLHEWGSSYQILIGPDVDHLTSIYNIDQWNPAFRDAPPIVFSYDSPMMFTKGTVVRSICNWNNTTSQELTYPKEMCATFGYAVPLETAWTCYTGVAPTP
jgi:hypothetical protein